MRIVLGSNPDYRVKESGRARHVRLKLSLREGLVVVVPKGFDRTRIPAILRSKQQWLQRARKNIESQGRSLAPEQAAKPPERIMLRAIGEEWAVDYRSTGSRHFILAEQEGHTLLVYGDTANPSACNAALHRWLNRKAHDHLVPWLRRLADEQGFRFSRTLIKCQKSRWASCSTDGTISLNTKLLFIPEELTRYVMIHELCHTVHMNHSPRFWALVAEHVQSLGQLKTRLRAEWPFMPGWLHAPEMRQGGRTEQHRG